MKKRALVTGGTCKDVAAMAVLVMNIKETNPNLVDEIVIFHDGISEKDQKLISSIFNTRFEYYQFPNYNPENFSPEISCHFSQMVFCKYECLRLLNDYSVVIWSDYDVLITKDISDLLTQNDENCKILPSGSQKIEVQFYPEMKTKYPEYDYTRIANCYSCFVFFDNFDFNSAYNYCINKASEWGKLLTFGEQGVFELMLQDFHLINSDLSSQYSVHPTKADKNTIIIHAFGRPKLWETFENEQWNNYYLEWKKIGGTKSYDPDTFMMRIIKKAKSLLKK